MGAGPARLGEISANRADFLHINSTARAGSRADIVHNINFKCALVHSLNFEAGLRQGDKQIIARRRSNLAPAYKDTLAITIKLSFLQK